MSTRLDPNSAALIAVLLPEVRKVVREEIQSGLAQEEEARADAGTDAFLTLSETCQRLRISPTTLYEMRRRGDLNGVNVGRRVLIREADVVALLAQDAA